MMHITLSHSFGFDAAFRPPGAGADDPPMGYSFQARIEAATHPEDAGAQGRLEAVARSLHAALDHAYLNTVIGADVTLARLAAWLLDAARAHEPAVVFVDVRAPQIAFAAHAKLQTCFCECSRDAGPE